MADIELMIKIPDHLYKLLKDFPSDSNETTIENVLMKAVENGTPLDKIIAGLEAHKWNKDEGSKAIYNSAINDAIAYIEECKAEK